MGRKAHVFPKLTVVGVLDLRNTGPISGACRRGRGGGNEVKMTDLVEIVLVELADKGRKVRMFEHPRQDGLCELVHILSREIRRSNLTSPRGSR